jgi:glucose/arabinose dehydrogenase
MSPRALLLASLFALVAAAPAAAQSDEVVGRINEPELRTATPERIAALQAQPGFRLTVAARGLAGARMMVVAPGGTVLLTRRDAGDVLALRDTDGDGTLDRRRRVARGLPLVHGIALRGRDVYLVTDTKLYRARLRGGRLVRRELLTDDLPDAGQHPSRTLGFGPDGRLYISVGSTCNACDDANPQNATLLRARPDGSRRRIFASGLRNLIGFAWDPRTGRLWGMDHGSDFRGDDQPPEELNLVRRGGDYGWPFCFGARQPDLLLPGEPPRSSRAQLCASTAAPALTYQAHSAPIGFAFAAGSTFPAGHRDDAYVAMHGSWNRGVPVGYKVVRVVFENGRPVGFEDFVTGFLIEDGAAQFGRPTGVVFDRNGSMLVADDANGLIYRVAAAGG